MFFYKFCALTLTNSQAKLYKNEWFIEKNYYRLPWITSYSNPSVETFNYKYELKNNNLKYGGHEGFIKNGFYEYLILLNDKKYDLNKYSLNKI